jgi:hypothetical protein
MRDTLSRGLTLAIVGPGRKDKGQGGKYLLLPPDYKGDVPASYFPVRQKSYDGFWLIRTIPNSAAQSDVDNAIALIKEVFSPAGSPGRTTNRGFDPPHNLGLCLELASPQLSVVCLA